MSADTSLRRARAVVGTAVASALAGCALFATAAPSAAQQTAPIPEHRDTATVRDTAIRGAASPAAIPGSYVVVLAGNLSAPSTRATTASLATTYGAQVRKQYTAAIRGFSATMDEEQAKKMAADERVAFVQQNQRFTANQDNPPWGLDRSDQRDLPLDQKFEPSTAAENVSVYVIDTGIYPDHQDFGGRASVGTDTIGDGQNGIDCAGHGSHVAGTIAGATYGVAKGAKVYGVRVLDCRGGGSTETVLAGVDWVTKNAKKPAVANMSLGGPADQALDTALKASVDSGVAYAVAAGNETMDACAVSPAREPSVLTVGATGDVDARAPFSNFGPCVDVFAPGVKIASVGIAGPDATLEMNGTSMATPHVAGAIALHLADHPEATPAEVTTALLGAATLDKVTDPGVGSPNKLLYAGQVDPVLPR